MPERLILVLALAAVLAVGILVVRTWSARNTRRVIQSGPVWAWAWAWESLGVQPDGRPTLIAFSTPSCAACHKAQAPAIDIAQKRIGAEKFRVIPVDAAEQPNVARAFGVMTVPSTVIVGAEGYVVAVNQGFAPSGKLLEQLQRA